PAAPNSWPYFALVARDRRNCKRRAGGVNRKGPEMKNFEFQMKNEEFGANRLFIFHLKFEISKEFPLKRPPLRRHALPLHEHPYVFADTIRQNEPPRLFALFAKKDWIGRRDFIQRLEQLVFSRAGGEQKFRLAIEEQRRE